MPIAQYVIRGGVQGRERLRLLSRVRRATTLSLLSQAGIPRNATCLDVGCGGGDVTLELARQVGPNGRVVGIDMDDVQLQLARTEAEEHGVRNVLYRTTDARVTLGNAEFDVVYSRCLLSHLTDPEACIASMHRALKPNGLLIIEDIEISGIFCYPDSAAVRRFRELYTQLVQRQGADPDIGRRIPILLLDAGFERVHMNVVQPAGIEGEVKFLPALSMELIADRVVHEGLAKNDEVQQVIEQMYESARDPRTVIGTARMVQVWASRLA